MRQQRTAMVQTRVGINYNVAYNEKGGAIWKENWSSLNNVAGTELFLVVSVVHRKIKKSFGLLSIILEPKPLKFFTSTSPLIEPFPNQEQTQN